MHFAVVASCYRVNQSLHHSIPFRTALRSRVCIEIDVREDGWLVAGWLFAPTPPPLVPRAPVRKLAQVRLAKNGI